MAPEPQFYALYFVHNLHFLAYSAMMEARYETALGAARHAAGDPQAAVPDLRDERRVLGVVLPQVDDVVEAGADDRQDHILSYFLLSSDLPNTALGSRVMLTVHRKSRGSTSVHLTLNSGGNGLLTGSFDTDVVWIEVTVVNGGTRYAGCAYGETPPGEGTCGGYPVDDGYPHRITVTAY